MGINNKVEKKETKEGKLPISLYFNIIAMALVLALNIKKTFSKEFSQPAFQYVAYAFIVCYALVFLGFVIYSLVSRKNIKKNLKEMKTAQKTFKGTMAIANKVILLVNLIGSIATLSIEIMDKKAAGARIGLLVYIALIATAFSMISAILFIVKKGKKINKANQKMKKSKQKEEK